MIKLLEALKDLFSEYWEDVDGWTRGCLFWLLAWPLVLMIFAPIHPYVAMLPLIPFLFIILASPVLTGITWSVDEGKEVIQALCAITAIELAIGLYLVVVPVENNREWIPVFILATVTLALLVVSGMKNAGARIGGGVLILLLIGISLTFCLEEYWPAFKARNPLPWWGFLIVAAFVAVGVWHGLKRREWMKFGALALFLIFVFAGWQTLYSGTTKTLKLPSTTSTLGAVGSLPKTDSVWVTTTTEWSREIVAPLRRNVDIEPQSPCEYQVKASDGTITTVPIAGSERVSLNGPLNRMQLRSTTTCTLVVITTPW